MASTTIKPDRSNVGVGNTLTTGQPNIEEFSNEEEMKERLIELEKQKNN